MYPSDYGYAADLSKCTKTLSKYNDSTCTSNNWLKAILGTSNYGWLLTPASSFSYVSWYVYSSGYVHNSEYDYIFGVAGVIPTLYLVPEVSISSGDGSSSSPYQLAV